MTGHVKLWQGARRAIAGIAVALMPAAAGITSAVAHPLGNLEQKLLEREKYVEIVNRKAPEFTLRNAEGTAVKLSDFAGKVVVLNFIYAHCPDVCPLHSEKIADIQKMIDSTPMRGLVQFVTITTDPEKDGPDTMKSYGAIHGLRPVNWIFLTSGVAHPRRTRKLAAQYGLKFTLGKDGYQMHGLVTHLIDKSGNLRARYHGLKFDETNMVVHINALTNDHH